MPGGTFLGLPASAWHALFNDFPVALLVSSAIFDMLATGGRRESMRAAAYWTLLGGAAGTVLAVASGLVVKGRFEQTATVHRMLEIHQWLGIALALVYLALAAWRVRRRNDFSAAQQQSYTTAALVAVLALLWTAHLGGRMVFGHAAGIPGDVLQTELDARAAESR